MRARLAQSGTWFRFGETGLEIRAEAFRLVYFALRPAGAGGVSQLL